MFHISKDFYEIRETAEKGRGVFALKTVEPGTVIGEYVGTVLRHDDAIETEDQGHFHMHLIEDIYCLADKNTLGTHLLNHSCAPACGVEDFKGHAVYFALRTIHPGEEITISYGLGKPNKFCNPCHHACHCESQFCRGSWHSADEEYDMTRDRSAAEYQQTLEEIERAVGTELQPLANPPTFYEDDDWFDIYASEHLDPESNSETTMPSIEKLRSKIRLSGRPQKFPKLGLTVLAVQGDVVSTKVS
jgi:hypothetical protein